MPKLSQKQIKTLAPEELAKYLSGEMKKSDDFFAAIQNMPDLSTWGEPQFKEDAKKWSKAFNKAKIEMLQDKNHIPERFWK